MSKVFASLKEVGSMVLQFIAVVFFFMAAVVEYSLGGWRYGPFRQTLALEYLTLFTDLLDVDREGKPPVILNISDVNNPIIDDGRRKIPFPSLNLVMEFLITTETPILRVILKEGDLEEQLSEEQQRELKKEAIDDATD